MSDERRAEIEAVARFISEAWHRKGGVEVDDWDRQQAEKAIAALDRLRDARGDDEDEARRRRLSQETIARQMARDRAENAERDMARLVHELTLIAGATSDDWAQKQIRKALAGFEIGERDG